MRIRAKFVVGSVICAALWVGLAALLDQGLKEAIAQEKAQVQMMARFPAELIQLRVKDLQVGESCYVTYSCLDITRDGTTGVFQDATIYSVADSSANTKVTVTEDGLAIQLPADAPKKTIKDNLESFYLKVSSIVWLKAEPLKPETK